jgi:hypothetical protein
MAAPLILLVLQPPPPATEIQITPSRPCATARTRRTGPMSAGQGWFFPCHLQLVQGLNVGDQERAIVSPVTAWARPCGAAPASRDRAIRRQHQQAAFCAGSGDDHLLAAASQQAALADRVRWVRRLDPVDVDLPEAVQSIEGGDPDIALTVLKQAGNGVGGQPLLAAEGFNQARLADRSGAGR